jgi:hypothetical protein
MWAREEERDTIFARVRRAFEEAERLMRDADPRAFLAKDGAWDNEVLRVDRRPDDASDPGPERDVER